jgi:hypothetical protein
MDDHSYSERILLSGVDSLDQRAGFEFMVLFIALISLFMATMLCSTSAKPDLIRNLTIIDKIVGHMGPNATFSYNIKINPIIPGVYFQLVWQNRTNDLSIVLHSPTGTKIDSLTNTSSIYFTKEETVKYYYVKSPYPGVWNIEIISRKIDAMDEKYCVLVYSPPYEEPNNLLGHSASLADIYRSQLIDDDEDGLYDHIDMTVNIKVMASGIYKVSASLCDDNETEVAHAFQETFLHFGMPSVRLMFYGMPHSGVYHLKNLTLQDDLGKTLDRRNYAYSTPMYKDLNPNPQIAKLIGNYTDHGIDINGEGKLEYLTVDIGMNAIFAGNYTLQGWLHDLNESEISWSVDQAFFRQGYHIMHLIFDGKTIEKNKKDGPYRLEDITLSARGTNGISTVNDFKDSYITNEYKYSDFGGSA